MIYILLSIRYFMVHRHSITLQILHYLSFKQNFQNFFFLNLHFIFVYGSAIIYIFFVVWGGGLGGGTAPLASPRIRHRTLHWHSDMSDSRQYPLKLCLIKHELDIIVFVFETDNFLIWIFTGFITFQAIETQPRLWFQGYLWESDDRPSRLKVENSLFNE